MLEEDIHYLSILIEWILIGCTGWKVGCTLDRLSVYHTYLIHR